MAQRMNQLAQHVVGCDSSSVLQNDVFVASVCEEFEATAHAMKFLEAPESLGERCAILLTVCNITKSLTSYATELSADIQLLLRCPGFGRIFVLS
eukprot:SAG31_NODE_2190_length_6229_cov_11.374388_4_plen_95_part_00